MRNLLTALLGAALVFVVVACRPDTVPLPGAPTAAPQSVVGGRAETPTPAPTRTPMPTPTPTEVAIATPAQGSFSVALVAPSDGDANRLKMAREGFQRAAQEVGASAFDVVVAPGDLARNAVRLAEAGYNLVFIASNNPPLVNWVAKRYPQTKFGTFGRVLEPTLPNVVGIWFAEDQAGFLAGALAGWLTKNEMVGFVGAAPTEEIVKFRKGYEHGLQYVDTKAIPLGKYIGSFDAPQKGAAEADAQIAEGPDFLFAAGGSTAQGALDEAAKRGLGVIAADVDPYQSDPALAPNLVATVLVHVDNAVADVVRSVKQNTFKPGTLTYDAKNGAIELGPFHDWDGKVSDAAKKQLREIYQGLQDGSVKTNVVIPVY